MDRIDTLYVSPHLDDAVFSAGAAIAAAERAGRRVVVLTAFSRGAGAGERRREDAAALELLGASGVDLDLPEAPERAPGPLRPARLFAPLDLDGEAGAAHAPLVAAIRDAVLRLAPAEVIGPLGVGRHADHQITHAAIAALQHPAVAFYEDLPYGLCPAATPRRLDELTTTAPARPSLRDHVAVARYWASRPILRGEAPVLFLPIAGLMVSRAMLSPAPPAAAPLSLVEDRLDAGATLDRKIEAIAAYRSQWPLFYPTLDGWREALVSHAGALGSASPIERVFRRR